MGGFEVNDMEYFKVVFVGFWCVGMFLVVVTLRHRKVSLLKIFLNPCSLFVESYFSEKGNGYRRQLLWFCLVFAIAVIVFEFYFFDVRTEEQI